VLSLTADVMPRGRRTGGQAEGCETPMRRSS